MSDEDVDALCRQSVNEFRVSAFDNVDVEGLKARERMSPDDARWIGRHLMVHGGSLDSYLAGQRLLAVVMVRSAG